MSVGTTAPATPADGLPVYFGANPFGTTITGLDAATTYSFAAWIVDNTGAFMGPAHTATLTGTRATIATTTSTPTGAATFTGSLTCGDTGAGIAGQVLTLLVQRRGDPRWLPMGRATSNVTGDVTLTVIPCQPRCDYRWQLVDSTSYMGAASTTITVSPVPRVPAQPPRSR